MSRLHLTRAGILGHRRRAGLLDQRVAWSDAGLRRATHAGLTDSMPRAALLSLHARLADVADDAWDDDALVQVWGPRYSVHVVHRSDAHVFTRGRLPKGGRARERAEDVAARLAAHLDGGRGDVRTAGEALGIHHNAIRYATTTGTVRIRWDGARQPDVWTVPAPAVDDTEARRELARRHLHVAGPATAASFGDWAGVRAADAAAVFAALADELVAVDTPVGEGWVLATDEDSFRAAPDAPAPARLLPSGDAYWLCWGADRELLVEDAVCRDRLWTSRVWPGAVLVDGEVVGTWRRAGHRVTVEPWRVLPPTARAAVEAEATSFPLPALDRGVEVAWVDVTS